MNKETKKLIPEMRFPEFVNDEEWEKKTLEEVCEVNPKVPQLPEQFVYIDLESVENGTLLQKKIIKSIGAPSRAQRLLKANDVIFQMVRPYQKNNYYFLKSDDLDYVASTGYAQLRSFESSMYLYQFIHTDRFVGNVLEKCTGSNYPAINSSDLSQISVQIPKPNEQQKIASCLSSLDELIAAHSQKLDALKTHKKGLMQNLFPQAGETIPKLRFPEFVKEGVWVEKVLSKITKAIFDGTHQTPSYTEIGIPFFSVENIVSGNKNKFISKADYEIATSKNKPEKGDILLTRIGKIGFSAFVDWDYEFSIYVTLACIKKSKHFNSYFLHSFFQSARYQKEIMSKSLLNAVPCKINMNELRETLVLLPPLMKEQQKIADCLSAIDYLINTQAEKVEQLKLHKKGLMQGLFPSLIK